MNVTFWKRNSPAPINTKLIKIAVKLTLASLIFECRAISIGLAIISAILCSTPAVKLPTLDDPICRLLSSRKRANRGMIISATKRLMNNAEIMVTGIARINLPKIPLTKIKGTKLKIAVNVAAIIARLTLPVATATAWAAFFCRRLWASSASTIIIVSSIIRAKPRIRLNNVMVFNV